MRSSPRFRASISSRLQWRAKQTSVDAVGTAVPDLKRSSEASSPSVSWARPPAVETAADQLSGAPSWLKRAFCSSVSPP
jgi:hypothetical protein